jgi:hypothetical protein
MATSVMALSLSVASASAQLTIRPEFPSTNGQVYATAFSGDTLYLGGSFTRLGEPAGAIGIDATYGYLYPSPHVVGSVSAIVSDGQGGWYLGGTFKRVGPLTCTNLAHIRADGSPYPWAPVLDGSVQSLLRSGTTLFVGGRFTQIAGAARSRLAAIDLPTRTPLPWTADVSGAGADTVVSALALGGGALYVGGSFGSVGGQPRANLAAVDAGLGSTTPWNPGPNSTVLTIAVRDTFVYAGGLFDSVGSIPRSLFALIGTNAGLPREDWPVVTAGNLVRTIAVDEYRVYVGGGFTSIGGQSRVGLAALDIANGGVTSWAPFAPSNLFVPYVTALALTDEAVFAASSAPTPGVVEFDKLTAAQAPWWYPVLGNAPETLALDGITLMCGGYSLLPGKIRNRAAAIRISTEELLPWDPNANGIVYAIAPGRGTVHLGGAFTMVGGVSRIGLAQVDTWSGATTSWTADLNSGGSVRALLLRGDTLVVGGAFTGLGGSPRNSLGAVRASSGMVTPWVATAAGGVQALASAGDTLYVGGSFTTLGGQFRPRLGSFDLTTGGVTTWSPTPSAPVLALTISGGTLVVGGTFSNFAGQPRSNLGAFDIVGRTLLPWNPAPSSSVQGLAATDSSVIVGGFFFSIGSASRYHLAEVRLADGLATAWNPLVGGSSQPITAVSTSAGVIAAGGLFGSVDGWSITDIAVFTAPPTVLATPKPVATWRLALLPSFPNPASTATTVHFRLAGTGSVRLSLFDLQGRLVRALPADRRLEAGDHYVKIDLSGVPPGAYWCRLESAGQAISRSLVIAR